MPSALPLNTRGNTVLLTKIHTAVFFSSGSVKRAKDQHISGSIQTGESSSIITLTTNKPELPIKLLIRIPLKSVDAQSGINPNFIPKPTGRLT